VFLGLLPERHVTALRELVEVGTGDAVRDVVGDIRGDLVVSTRQNQRVRLYFSESITQIPLA